MTPAPPVTLTELLPGHGAVDSAGAEAHLVSLYDNTALSGHTPGLRVQANMVQAVNGAVAGADGLSGSISSPADKRVFSVLRSLADAVVVGAGTARAERYTRLHAKAAHAHQRRERGQWPEPTLVIVTASGNVDAQRLTEAGTSPVLICTLDSSTNLGALREALGHHSVAVLPDLEPRTVLERLKAQGMARILTEGGPSLLGEWVAAGVVDELCLTIAPTLAQQPEGPPASILGTVSLPQQVDAHLLSALLGEDALICRWGLARPRTA